MCRARLAHRLLDRWRSDADRSRAVARRGWQPEAAGGGGGPPARGLPGRGHWLGTGGGPGAFSPGDYLDEDEITYERLLALDGGNGGNGGGGGGGGGDRAEAAVTDRAIRDATAEERFRLPPAVAPGAGGTASAAAGAAAGAAAASRAESCVICLEEFEAAERLLRIRSCRCSRALLYHGPCLRKWLKADPSCPQCRAGVV